MAANDLEPARVEDLVVLMCRADWTKLSLVADIAEFFDFHARMRMEEPPRRPRAPQAGPFPGGRPAHGHRPADDDDDEEHGEPDPEDLGTARERTRRLLLAPGGRYRFQDVPADETEQPPCAELLCPAWLPAGFRLESAGSASVAGRRAQRVIGTQRVAVQRRRRARRAMPRPAYRTSGLGEPIPDGGRIDALVDVELGILLRCEQIYGGQVVSRREITSLTLSPPETADPAQFAPPDQDAPADHESPFSGPGRERVMTAANIGATAMGFAIRHAPHREPPPGSQPDADNRPPRGRDGWPGPDGPDEPVPDEFLKLLYDAGLRSTGFDAELRTWGDTAAAADAFTRTTRNTTVPGVRQLGDALRERAVTWQSRETIKIGLPNRYRIEYIDGGIKRRPCTTEAADGAQRWRVYAGHVLVGPARGLPARIARLVDPAWLLDWELTGGAEVIEGGRRGFLIQIRQRYQAGDTSGMRRIPVEAVVDAELGILLWLAQELGGRLAKQQSLAAVAVRPERDIDEFRIDIPRGMRVVTESGSLLDEVEMPAPVHTAVYLAGKTVSAAIKVGGLLDSLRRSGRPPDG